MELNTKKCPFCSEEILETAIKCKHCGEFLNKKDDEKEDKDSKLKLFKIGKKEKKKGSCGNAVAGVILFFIFIGVIFAIMDESGSSDTSTSLSSNNGDVAAICAQRYIKLLLKSPSSAKFPWNLKSSSLGGNKYKIVNYVDSQNSFGAMIRTNYSCEVTVKNPKEFLCDTSCDILD